MTSSTPPQTPSADPASGRASAADSADYEDQYDEADVDPEAASSEDGDEPSPTALLAAGLIGAALGAGLGLLASRALAEDASYADQMRRRVLRARRDATRGFDRIEGRVRRRGAAAADDAGEVLSSAVRSLSRTREEFGDRIERELRSLRKLVRQGRRRGWLR